MLVNEYDPGRVDKVSKNQEKLKSCSEDSGRRNSMMRFIFKDHII